MQFKMKSTWRSGEAACLENSLLMRKVDAHTDGALSLGPRVNRENNGLGGLSEMSVPVGQTLSTRCLRFGRNIKPASGCRVLINIR